MARVKNPLVQVAVLYVVALLSASVGGEAGALAATGLMTVFAVVNPLTCALGTAWWVQTVASSALFALLFAALGATPGVAALREGAMVFLLPLVVYAAAVPVGGLLRLSRARRADR